MPPAKKPASRRSAAPKRPTAKDQAAIKRLNKSLDAAQDALASLGKDVSKDLGAGGRDLYKNLQRFIKDARRDSGKLSKALERDIERLQKRLARVPQAKTSSRAPTRRKAARRSTAKRTTVAQRLAVGVAGQAANQINPDDRCLCPWRRADAGRALRRLAVAHPHRRSARPDDGLRRASGSGSRSSGSRTSPPAASTRPTRGWGTSRAGRRWPRAFPTRSRRSPSTASAPPR